MNHIIIIIIIELNFEEIKMAAIAFPLFRVSLQSFRNHQNMVPSIQK